MRLTFRTVLPILGALALPNLASLPALAGDAPAVIVPLDVDVYGVPEDDSTKRPEFLRGGSEVLLLEQRSDDWCHVAPGRDPIPGGEGWIWCGSGGDDGDYRVQPAGAAPAGGPGEEPGGAG